MRRQRSRRSDSDWLAATDDLGPTTHGDVATLRGSVPEEAIPRRDPLLTLYFAAKSHLQAFTSDRGASMVEYALLVVLIAIIAILAIRFAGTQVSQTFSTIGDSLANP